MKWFKHDTDARNDTRIKLLKKKFGAEGYGVYFQLLEIVGENIKESNHEEWGFVEEIHTIETLADESGVSPDKLRQMLAYMNDIGLLYKIDGKLSAPKILTRLDEYARKRKGDLDVFERKKELEGHYQENVKTNSQQSPGLEQNKKRKEEKREEKLSASINYLKQIPEEDLKEFSNSYLVDFKGIIKKAQDLVNYCEMHGKRYKDYKALLRNAISKDFGVREQKKGMSISEQIAKAQEEGRIPKQP